MITDDLRTTMTLSSLMEQLAEIHKAFGDIEVRLALTSGHGHEVEGRAGVAVYPDSGPVVLLAEGKQLGQLGYLGKEAVGWIE